MLKVSRLKLIGLAVVLGALLAGSCMAIQAVGGQWRSLKWQKIALTFLAASIFLTATGCDETISSTRNYIIRLFWTHQAELIDRTPNQVFDQPKHGYDPRAYPAEAAISFLSAWLITGEEQYVKIAERQLSYARSLERSDHTIVLPDDGRISSNLQARLVLGYFLAHRATGNSNYLKWADEAMEALLRFPRAEVQWDNRSFKLFKYTPDSFAQLDPNQQVVIGLVMTLLYHEPRSRYHLDTNMRTMALEQLDASIALMTEDGRLPLAQEYIWVDKFDTYYGSFTFFLLSYANRFWRETRYDEALQRSVRWLNEYTRSGTTLRYYPKFYNGPPPDPTELWWRLPVLYHYKGDILALQRSLQKIWHKWPTYADYPGGWITPFLVLEQMGIPSEVYYGEPKKSVRTKP